MVTSLYFIVGYKKQSYQKARLQCLFCIKHFGIDVGLVTKTKFSVLNSYSNTAANSLKFATGAYAIVSLFATITETLLS